VFARMNFLLGLGLLILIAFYCAGAYLLLPLVEMSAPRWVRPAAGAAVLAAVALTVQLLSMAMGSLRGIALYKTGERAGLLAYVGQGTLILGHVAMLYAAETAFSEGLPVPFARLLLIALLYAGGTALAYLESRRRTQASA
jgi:hypothetical protein